MPLNSRNGRNADAISHFHQHMADQRRRRTDDPKRQFRIYSAKVPSELSKLLPKVEAAKKFLERVEQRKERGALDESAACIESMPAQAAISLYDLLVTLYDKASESGDNFALSSINVAADSLRERLERRSSPHAECACWKST